MRWDRIATMLGAAAVSAAGFWGCGGDEEGSGSGSVTSSSSSTSTSSTTGSGGSGGLGGSGGSGGLGGSGGSELYVGRACVSDGDCGPEGKCITADEDYPGIAGGAANGYCTQLCVSASDCPGVNSLCLPRDDSGEMNCFLGCDYGSSPRMYLDSPLDPNKCHGREDLRCQPIPGFDDPICIPTCGRDEQCGSRACDPRNAVCVDTPNTGLPDGSRCDPSLPDPGCAGRCVNFVDGRAFCTRVCVQGGRLDSDDCGGLDKGICALDSAVGDESSNGAGDLGYCTPICNVHSDCLTPNLWCTPSDFGPNKYCLNATPCPGGDADCSATGRADLVCTETPLGSFCLSPEVPLGDLGGGGAGGGGSAGGP